MTESGLLEHILDRLGRAESAEEIFGADEAAEWPSGALDVLTKAGLLGRAQPAQVIECDGCERNCFMLVHVRPAEDNRPARAFIACDKPEDMGRIPVELQRLEQWRMTRATLASAIARLLGFAKTPQEELDGKLWALGLLKNKEYTGEVRLSIDGGVSLSVAGQSIPLSHVLALTSGKIEADKEAVLGLVRAATREPAAGIGSVEWRKQSAKAAANARHSKPGGSREKQDRIREVWASGKYTTRDICAEEEYAALDMSFSAARKALRNTPDPKRPSRC